MFGAVASGATGAQVISLIACRVINSVQADVPVLSHDWVPTIMAILSPELEVLQKR